MKYFRQNLFKSEKNIKLKRIVYKSFSELINIFTEKCIKLRYSIDFKIEIDKNGFYYINDMYNIYAYGETQKDAENDILEEFKIQNNSYVFTSDDDLDENAKILKRNLLNICGDINAKSN